MLMGLAMYNGILLDLPLPLACYKKLLGVQPDLDDFAELEPEKVSSLKFVMNSTDKDLETTLCQNFTVVEEVFGENVTTELVEGGAEIMVN
jgi:hypothetical protein